MMQRNSLLCSSLLRRLPHQVPRPLKVVFSRYCIYSFILVLLEPRVDRPKTPITRNMELEEMKKGIFCVHLYLVLNGIPTE